MLRPSSVVLSQENLSIRTLLLAQNGFGRIEAEALGQALKSNATIEVLDLSHNYIDDEATSLLCQGLVQNNTLRVIKVRAHRGSRINPFCQLPKLVRLRWLALMPPATSLWLLIRAWNVLQYLLGSLQGLQSPLGSLSVLQCQLGSLGYLASFHNQLCLSV